MGRLLTGLENGRRKGERWFALGYLGSIKKRNKHSIGPVDLEATTGLLCGDMQTQQMVSRMKPPL